VYICVCACVCCVCMCALRVGTHIQQPGQQRQIPPAQRSTRACKGAGCLRVQAPARWIAVMQHTALLLSLWPWLPLLLWLPTHLQAGESVGHHHGVGIGKHVLQGGGHGLTGGCE